MDNIVLCLRTMLDTQYAMSTLGLIGDPTARPNSINKTEGKAERRKVDLLYSLMDRRAPAAAGPGVEAARVPAGWWWAARA